jgi:hypothetical protein
MRVLLKRAETNPNYPVSETAVVEFIRLLEENRLPGITIEQIEGSIKESGFGLAEQSIHFPEERTIRLHKKGEPDTEYCYTIAKNETNSQWVLVLAFKESKGKRVVLSPLSSGTR